MFSTRIWLGWLPTGQKTSCWAVWIQEFSQPVQWQIQYLDLARSHSVEGFKTTSLCKGSSKIWSFVASESMSFAAPVRFSIIKLLFSASESFCFEAWLIRCFTGSRKDQKLKEQLTFTASGCHKFPWPGVHLQLRSSLRLARFTHKKTGQYEQWRNMATLEDVLDFCKFCFCPTFFAMILSPFEK